MLGDGVVDAVKGGGQTISVWLRVSTLAGLKVVSEQRNVTMRLKGNCPIMRYELLLILVTRQVSFSTPSFSICEVLTSLFISQMLSDMLSEIFCII